MGFWWNLEVENCDRNGNSVVSAHELSGPLGTGLETICVKQHRTQALNWLLLAVFSQIHSESQEQSAEQNHGRVGSGGQIGCD